MTGYTATIVNGSREFTARERMRIKDTTAATPLDEAVTAESPLEMELADWATLKITNERSKGEKEYMKFVLIDKSGNHYTSGSESLISAVGEIAKEMWEEAEPWKLLIYKKESKNYKGKYFLTATVV